MTGEGHIRADLHNHTHFSPDSILSPERLVERCLTRKIGCIAVTDHNTIRGGIDVSRIVEARHLEALTVIVGEEVRSAEGEILGLFLTGDIPQGLTGKETIDRIKSQGGVVGVPHPFDHMRSALDYQRMVALMGHIDFIETFNARIVFKSHNDDARRFAENNGLAKSAASDAHSPREIGRAYVEMAPFDGPTGFLDSLREGRTAGRISSPLIHMVSRFAVIRRRLGWRPE